MARVCRLLLFPVSTIESPNTMTAGNLSAPLLGRAVAGDFLMTNEIEIEREMVTRIPTAAEEEEEDDDEEDDDDKAVLMSMGA